MSNEGELKNKGLKVTLPRMKVLEVFMESSKRHLGAEEIHLILSQNGYKASLATVYRVLSQFEDTGIVNRVQFESGVSFFELNDRDDHDHLVCLKCGKVEEFYDPALIEMQKRVANKYGFTVDEHCNVISGLCDQCRKK